MQPNLSPDLHSGSLHHLNLVNPAVATVRGEPSFFSSLPASASASSWLQSAPHYHKSFVPDKPSFVPTIIHQDIQSSLHLQRREQNHVRQRRAAVACQTPPCEVCESGRETGDANADCVFDIKDAAYTQTFLANSLFDADLINTLLPTQKKAMDIDMNGVINPADAFYLARVNFKLTRFVTNLTITPVSLPTTSVGSSCRLTISARILEKGDVGTDPSQTHVYVDLESTDPDLSQQYDATVFEVGTKVEVDKSGGDDSFNGGLVEAAAQTSGDDANNDGTFSIVAATPFALSDIGLSIILITTDATGQSSDTRTATLFGSPDPPFTFVSKMDFALTYDASSGEAVNILASSGYNPLTTFDHPISSLTCHSARSGCNSTTQFESVPATLSSDATCSNLTLCTVGQAQSAAPTATSDRTCQACNGVTEYQDEAESLQCKPVTHCTGSQYQIRNSTASIDAVCQNLTVCSSTQYESAPPTPTSDLSCNNLTICVIGQTQLVAPTATSDRQCRACDGVTEYQDTPGSLTCKPVTVCSANQYQAVNSTPFTNAVCLNLTVCGTGEQETTSATATSDRSCGACSAGTFKDANSSTCQTTTVCQEGTYIAVEATSSADTVCLPCDGVFRFQNATNQDSCRNVTDCLPGFYEISPPTSSSNRICGPCTVGVSYQDMPNQPACKNVTVCQPGEYENLPASAAKDTECGQCDGIFFYQDEPNQPTCKNVTTCPASTYTAKNSTAFSDSFCLSCTLGEDFSSTAGQSACQNVSECQPGSFVLTPATLTEDVDCFTCVIGVSFSNTTNAPSCTPLSFCSPGTAERVAATLTSDRVCQECVLGETFQAGFNATTCLNVSAACLVGLEYQVQAPTLSSNRVCASCFTCPIGMVQVGGCDGFNDTVCDFAPNSTTTTTTEATTTTTTTASTTFSTATSTQTTTVSSTAGSTSTTPTPQPTSSSITALPICFYEDVSLDMADGSRKPIATIQTGDVLVDIYNRSHTVRQVFVHSNLERLVTFPPNVFGKGLPSHKFTVTDSHLIQLPGGEIEQAKEYLARLEAVPSSTDGESSLLAGAYSWRYGGIVYHISLDEWVMIRSSGVGLESAALSERQMWTRKMIWNKQRTSPLEDSASEY
eukprot:m.232695 g.232695  ORF g.232695 m.232695 type:complete len:1121 (+) comp26492_c2_seq1:5255-8617(+)